MSDSSEKDKFLYGIAKVACQSQEGLNELRFILEAVTKTIGDFPEMAPIFHAHYREITAGEEARALRSDSQELRDSLSEIGQSLGLE